MSPIDHHVLMVVYDEKGNAVESFNIHGEYGEIYNLYGMIKEDLTLKIDSASSLDPEKKIHRRYSFSPSGHRTPIKN
ncbi:hypothetical protein [Persicobacter sp. CCB-QB2]|uniref:hypothetical protein n=1 Tax=Persicobacter sp. CCB-QB2 TaxID=1561025 RepID=UPI0012F915BD|nr:hypothetical protein [Persicobacter sp. CCB-QB2]